MRAPASTHHHGESHEEFCARCLVGVEAGASCCPRCRVVFAGAARFHLMLGTEAEPLWMRLLVRLPQGFASELLRA